MGISCIQVKLARWKWNCIAMELLVPNPTPKTLDLNPTENNFDTQLSKGRACIENAFAFLKSRFRILKYIINAELPKAATIMIATCVLHNICQSDDPNYRQMLDMNTEAGKVIESAGVGRNTRSVSFQTLFRDKKKVM